MSLTTRNDPAFCLRRLRSIAQTLSHKVKTRDSRRSSPLPQLMKNHITKRNAIETHAPAPIEQVLVTDDRPDERKTAVIVVHGSFNPVHQHHIAMMIAAKHRLKTEGYCVFHGLMGITSQEALRRKCKETLSDDERLHCIDLACKEDINANNWLTSEPRGVSFKSGSLLCSALKGIDYATPLDVVVSKSLGPT